MKKIKSLLFLITIISFSIFTSCSSDEISSEQRAIDAKKHLEFLKRQKSLRDRETLQEEIIKQKDSLINAKLQQLKKSLKDSIQIIKAYTSEPNSAGGVDLNIVWKNKTKRIVKYARFKVSAINAVNDEVYSEISHFNSPEYVRVTGPVNPNKINGYGTYWSSLWYNYTIEKCIVRSVELEFMDGTNLEIIL